MTTELEIGDDTCPPLQSHPAVLYAWLEDGCACLTLARPGEGVNIFPSQRFHGGYIFARLRPADASRLRALLNAFLGDADDRRAETLERSIVEHVLQTVRLRATGRHIGDDGSITFLGSDADLDELAQYHLDAAVGDAKSLLVARSRKP